MAVKEWGNYGNEPPCEHLIELLGHLYRTGMDIWSEHGESPSGWVNVKCKKCGRTYETTLDPRINRSGEHDAT